MSIALMLLSLAPAGNAAIPSPPCLADDPARIVRVAALPRWARAALPMPMADRDQPFNASDMIFPDSPPQRRLICAYRRNADWVVEYEQGGIGHFRKRVILRPPAKAG